MTIDPTKKYTFNGHQTRVICTDAQYDNLPVIALVKIGFLEDIARLQSDGRTYTGDIGLIEAPPDVTVYLNEYYLRSVSGPFDSREQADSWAKDRPTTRQGIWELNLTTKQATYTDLREVEP